MKRPARITERIDAVTWLTPEYLSPCLPPPKAVKIELTARCDFRCSFCSTGRALVKRGDIEWDLLTRILRDARGAGVREAGLFYLGEAMLYPRLADAVRYAKRECLYPFVFLTTNGRVASEAKIDACVRAGLDSLKFSLNAPGRAQFLEVTGRDAFDTVIANIKRARRVIDRVREETGHVCRLYVSSVIHSDIDRAPMDAMVAELLPYLDEHYYLPMHAHAHVEAGLSPKNAVGGAAARYAARRAPLPCWSLFTVAHVTHRGRISACCWDHDDRFTCGDLTETSFMEAWNSAGFQRLRSAHLALDVRGTVCEACVAAHGKD
jgi:MoaA/NifB/PqqE/SkfB family radical SAM enzyme